MRARHGPNERQIIYFIAAQCSQEGRERKGTRLRSIDFGDGSCIETHKPVKGGMEIFVLPMT